MFFLVVKLMIMVSVNRVLSVSYALWEKKKVVLLLILFNNLSDLKFLLFGM